MHHSQAPCAFLIARPLLDLLEKQVPSLMPQMSRLLQELQTQRYPDGSVLLEDAHSVERFSEFYKRNCLGALCWSAVFRSLGPFRRCVYWLQYPKAYFESLMPTGFVAAGSSPTSAPAPSEYKLDDMAITTGFRHRPTREIMERFAGMVHKWCESVRDQGMFGEGPIRRISSDVEFEGLRAQFRVDARLSGQNTLNWFVLQALQFGIDLFAVKVVLLTNEELLDQWFGASKGKLVRVPIAPGVATRTTASRSRVRAALPDGIATDCVPCKEFKSRLPLFSRPIVEWDALSVTVYFTASPSPDQKAAYHEIIKAWGTIGYYGGLGGTGIHHLGEVRFDDAAASATVDADMGDAKGHIALPLLLSVLEGFDQSVVPIEAVVFGTGLSASDSHSR